MNKNSIMQRFSVGLVEDREDVATEFKRLIADSKDFRFQGWHRSAESFLENMDSGLPELLVVDLGLPGMDGIDLISAIRSRDSDVRIVAYTVFDAESTILAAIRAGANGYLLKENTGELLITELKVMALGGAPLSRRVAELILESSGRGDGNRPAGSPLSQRELEILNLIALGLRYAEVAEKLDISLHTVRRHIESIYRKLNVHSATEAVFRARRFGLMG
ncbi:MAG: response regulator transcription factor [Leptospiraceae bacterium]|nr:response regulator transcription factor [Leptospiraceae bacterium]